MSDFQAPVRKPSILDDRKFFLTAPAPGGEGKSNLRIRTGKNNVRLLVYTNVKSDKDNGKIEARLDAVHFKILLEMIQDVAKTNVPGAQKLECLSGFRGKERVDPYLVSTIFVGRNNDGEVYIAVVPRAEGYSKVQFVFGSAEFHNIAGVGGVELTNQRVSELYALGWVKTIGPLVEAELIQNFDPDAELEAQQQRQNNYQNNGNGGGGNYGNKKPWQNRNNNSGSASNKYGGGGNNNYQGGGSNSNAGDFDNDIPF